jgi:ABC-type amino acid transport substrate-binding protein
VPPNAALAAMLLDGTVDAFAANRSRMETLARGFPAIRVLDDNFMVVGQAIVVAQGERERLAALNPFLAEVRTSGFVQASIDSANIPAVEVAPEP